MSGEQVEIDWKGLRRAWRRAQYEELWFQFRPDPNRPVLELVEQAVLATNDEVDPAEMGEAAFAEGVSDTQKGPAILLSRTGGDAEMEAWFETFARRLSAAGAAGKVVGAPESYLPDWLSRACEKGVQFNAFLSFPTVAPETLSDREREAGWLVTRDATTRIVTRAANWAAFDGAVVHLRRNLFQIRTTTHDVSEPLVDGLLKSGMAGAWYVDSGRRRAIEVQYLFNGTGIYSLLEEGTPWQNRLSQILDVVLGSAADIQLGFIRYAGMAAGSWDNMDLPGPRLPVLRGSDIRYHPHLLGDFVPDAHGIQVLTDRHLARANDLDNWRVEPLEAGRYLVTSSDLEGWYASDRPRPEVLERARADFGDMILTRADLRPRS